MFRLLGPSLAPLLSYPEWSHQSLEVCVLMMPKSPPLTLNFSPQLLSQHSYCLYQSFLTGDNSVSQGTFGHVCRCFWSSQLGLGALLASVVAGKHPTVQRTEWSSPQSQQYWGWETLATPWLKVSPSPLFPKHEPSFPSCAPHTQVIQMNSQLPHPLHPLPQLGDHLVSLMLQILWAQDSLLSTYCFSASGRSFFFNLKNMPKHTLGKKIITISHLIGEVKSPSVPLISPLTDNHWW